MLTLSISELSVLERMHYLQSSVAPRPIALASTTDKEGNVNLSPFSFFNLFSTNPPIIIFSPARRGRDNTTKHTLQNIIEHPEVVVNIVDYDIVQQMSLSSCEYPKGTNEFEKAGFTAVNSVQIKPPRVKESKIQMECKVIEVKSLGEEGGAGQLVIAEILMMHIHESILNEQGKIDQSKIQHVARLGNDWYCKVDINNLFEVEKPNTKLGIGFDALPQSLKQSTILTGNHLGQLANVSEMPSIDPVFDDEPLKKIIQYYSVNPTEMEREIHLYAAELLNAKKLNEAWQVLLSVV